MTKSELIKKETERTERMQNMLDLIPEEWDFVASVDGTNTVYCDDLNLWEDCLTRLHLLRSVFGKYELKGYYGCYSGLALVYIFEETLINGQPLRVIVYCDEERDKALEVVGKGKCKLVEKYSTPYKTNEVVCDLT